jgi:hypothetical protein
MLAIDLFGGLLSGRRREAADGKRHLIKGSCSLGRTAANTIVLESPKVSRRYALIHLQDIGELDSRRGAVLRSNARRSCFFGFRLKANQ